MPVWRVSHSLSDETVAKSDIRLLDEKNKNQGWKRFIEDKEVILVRLDADPLELGHRYSVFGSRDRQIWE